MKTTHAQHAPVSPSKKKKPRLELKNTTRYQHLRDSPELEMYEGCEAIASISSSGSQGSTITHLEPKHWIYFLHRTAAGSVWREKVQHKIPPITVSIIRGWRYISFFSKATTYIIISTHIFTVHPRPRIVSHYAPLPELFRPDWTDNGEIKNK